MKSSLKNMNNWSHSYILENPLTEFNISGEIPDYWKTCVRIESNEPNTRIHRLDPQLINLSLLSGYVLLPYLSLFLMYINISKYFQNTASSKNFSICMAYILLLKDVDFKQNRKDGSIISFQHSHYGSRKNDDHWNPLPVERKDVSMERRRMCWHLLGKLWDFNPLWIDPSNSRLGKKSLWTNLI